MNPYLTRALKEQQEKRVAAVAQSNPEGYAAFTVAELRDEVSRRNEGRDDEARILLGSNKSDLMAALEADDSE